MFPEKFAKNDINPLQQIPVHLKELGSSNTVYYHQYKVLPVFKEYFASGFLGRADICHT
jgi:hypothetical protein